ncbi:hypothetical protein GCM10009127_28250 [Alteraurantiacibacter aestuarii]|uniref:DUF4163 domain-containing protein n=1 Tax=Alteraurantiacibacter aestuarii TaxID=650004 RepID=A0A844ZM81_9SPHN|nr:DUF4163 domain-containing protein [Alteraurantiacibacter aestuarii]MXO88935.1 DUF4163 domain-containing protein [Alteraurantiacibacter aestuarii]
MLLVSCGQEGENGSQPGDPAATATASPGATATAVASESPVNGARTVAEETDDFRLEYSYPAEAGNIQELAALLDRRLDRLRNAMVGDSAEARADARDNGFPFNKYSTEVEWQVVADTPRYLSLSAKISSYTGGAHGNYGFDALVWDKERAAALEPETFFTTPEALEAALGSKLCEKLNRERAERRGQPIAEGSSDIFDVCVPLSDTTVLFGSASGRAFDRVGVQIGPYVAGPYAEGSYEFTFDVDDKLLTALRDEYRSAFTTRN